MRKVIAVALSFLVQWGAITGPLVHAHPDDAATAHHDGRAVHAHWGGHAHSSDHSESPSLDADDHDRALFVNAFVAVSASVPEAPVVGQGAFALPVPAERASQRGIEVVRSHDPPLPGCRCPRAPPSVLS